MDKREFLRNGLNILNLQSDVKKLDLVIRFIEEIIEWNKHTNLTSIIEEKEIFIKHIFDSLSPSNEEDFSDKDVIDIGTGAGLPGIPLKIVLNNFNLTLLDSSIKKTIFLNNVCMKLGIRCKIINESAEVIGHQPYYRENFDLALVRAVGNINTLIEYCIPLLKIGGKAIFYKGPNCEKEVENCQSSLKRMSSIITKNVEIELPLSEYRRRIIVVEKLEKTDLKFPRRVGLPKKKPL